MSANLSIFGLWNVFSTDLARNIRRYVLVGTNATDVGYPKLRKLDLFSYKSESMQAPAVMWFGARVFGSQLPRAPCRPCELAELGCI